MRPYSVKSVATLLGVSPHTLRAWENRYQAITPQRSPTGRRQYSAEEVERLRRLVRLTQQGHAIGSIAQLSDRQLTELDGTPQPAPLKKEVPPERLQRLLEALKGFRFADLSRELEWARISLSGREFVLNVISPLMGEVGQLVEQSALSIAQEHALSAIIRDHVGQILQLLQNHRQALPGAHDVRLILTTPEGDLHEFGILLAAVLCAHHGVAAHYLGPNLPAEALVEATRALGANLVLLGHAPVPESERPQPFLEYLQTLDRGLDPSTPLWVGGQGPWPRKFSSPTGRRVERLSSLGELDQRLHALSRP